MAEFEVERVGGELKRFGVEGSEEMCIRDSQGGQGPFFVYVM